MVIVNCPKLNNNWRYSKMRVTIMCGPGNVQIETSNYNRDAC